MADDGVIQEYLKRLICGLISIPSSHPSNLFHSPSSRPSSLFTSSFSFRRTCFHFHSIFFTRNFPSAEPAFTFIQFFHKKITSTLFPLSHHLLLSFFIFFPSSFFRKTPTFLSFYRHHQVGKEDLNHLLFLCGKRERYVNLSTHPIIMNVTSDDEILASILRQSTSSSSSHPLFLLLFRFLLHKKSFLHHSSSLFSFIKMAFCQKVVSSAFVILLWIYPSPLFSLHPLFLSLRLSFSISLSPSLSLSPSPSLSLSLLKTVSSYHSLLKDVLVS